MKDVPLFLIFWGFKVKLELVFPLKSFVQTEYLVHQVLNISGNGLSLCSLWSFLNLAHVHASHKIIECGVLQHGINIDVFEAAG